jgi:hypothetical protein
MKRICAALVGMALGLSVHAVQEVKLKDVPPLTPLNWCTDANGVTKSQIEPCGIGQTVGSSISTVQYEKKGGDPIPAAAPAKAQEPAAMEAKGGALGDFWTKWGKWIALGLAGFFVLKWFRRSA